MLTDTAIRLAKPGTKPRKLFDASGLYLLVTPTGGKWWRLKYQFRRQGKAGFRWAHTLRLGSREHVGSATRRGSRSREGIDPAVERKAAKAAAGQREGNGFEAVAREWFEKFSPGWALFARKDDHPAVRT